MLYWYTEDGCIPRSYFMKKIKESPMDYEINVLGLNAGECVRIPPCSKVRMTDDYLLKVTTVGEEQMDKKLKKLEELKAKIDKLEKEIKGNTPKNPYGIYTCKGIADAGYADTALDVTEVIPLNFDREYYFDSPWSASHYKIMLETLFNLRAQPGACSVKDSTVVVEGCPYDGISIEDSSDLAQAGWLPLAWFKTRKDAEAAVKEVGKDDLEAAVKVYCGLHKEVFK